MTGFNGARGILYIVATPIGNLGDMTYRAVEVLKSVDLIASEDTRDTGRLLAHFGISTPLTSYHDHNERQKSPELIEQLINGKSIALVSDAGTPLISDPGYRLVNLAIENGIDIIPIPGASSILAALVVSGYATDRFTFEGYLPKTSGRLKMALEKLANEPRTVVLFETPHRIQKSLRAMYETLGDREIFIGRELTKKFEEHIRGKISQILMILEKRNFKGEMVIVIPGSQRE